MRLQPVEMADGDLTMIINSIEFARKAAETLLSAAKAITGP
jgi:hypothetical protein